MVLAIMGVLVAALMPGRFSASEGLEMRAAARGIVDGLQRTRSLALLSGAPTLFSIDVDQRRFRAASDKTASELPSQAKVTLRTALGNVADRSLGGIRFFPNGGSTGGGITLAANGAEYRIAVNWLTGRIEVSDAP